MQQRVIIRFFEKSVQWIYSRSEPAGRLPQQTAHIDPTTLDRVDPDVAATCGVQLHLKRDRTGAVDGYGQPLPSPAPAAPRPQAGRTGMPRRLHRPLDLDREGNTAAGSEQRLTRGNRHADAVEPLHAEVAAR